MNRVRPEQVKEGADSVLGRELEFGVRDVDWLVGDVHRCGPGDERREPGRTTTERAIYQIQSALSETELVCPTLHTYCPRATSSRTHVCTACTPRYSAVLLLTTRRRRVSGRKVAA
jgi:hypothetical protein